MDFRVDDLARRLFESMPPAMRHMRQDLEANFRAVLRANLSRLELLARDEFTAQTKVLERTRARLEALEHRLAELEAKVAAQTGAQTGSPAGAPSGGQRAAAISND